MDIYERSLQRHRETQGKIEVRSRMRLESIEELSIAYTPGVARPCQEIAANPAAAWELTWKGRVVAVVSDGSSVLGLGDIGAEAALPVMEGKAALFREFAGIDAVPLVLRARESSEIVSIVKAIAPTFGGINLEDISAPRCFEIEEALQDIGIPVMHDDQHGTAVVLLAAVTNAARVRGSELGDLSVVINGAGAAGSAIAKLLAGSESSGGRPRVGKVRICDSHGIIHAGRDRNTEIKEELGRMTNPGGDSGSLTDALRGADAFIGVSRGDLLCADDIRTMAQDAIVLAMANPVPEIDPDEARRGGALVVGTGRSDYPNQVNNVLAFPGMFRGALEARAAKFTDSMKLAAVGALVEAVDEPGVCRILPAPFDRSVAVDVARRVAEAARKDEVCHL